MHRYPEVVQQGLATLDRRPAIYVSSESDAWYHVDAAWGGSAGLSPKLRESLRGIERADSVTWDAVERQAAIGHVQLLR